ncbi:MAG: restriction endonuclease subunit S [Acidobacteriaceae bacterium]
MIADLKPYAEYKESELPWLGKVPAHWDKRRMKFLFNERIEKGFPNEPLLAATQSKGVVEKKDYGTRTVTATKDFHLLKLVETGDFVISLRSFEGGIEVSHCRGIISPAYTILSPKAEASQGYYSRFFKSFNFIGSLTLFVTGIREGQNIDYVRLSRAYMPLPPANEQVAIGRFLDWANGRLERTIKAKRKVIALLNEQKQAIIHRAVTRGIDSSVPLKPSGISWLGDIPQHWEAIRSKYIYREVDSRSETGEETHLSMSQKFGLIPYSQIEEKRLVSESYAGAKLCEKGDLVLNRLKAHLGVFALAPERGLVSPDYTVLRPSQELDERYFEAVYRSPACRVELRKRTKGIVQGFWRLYTDDFYDIRVPFPPVEEQRQIIAQLDIDLSGINTAISRLEREIDLIREYRIRLVADVVTGKLDVREAASKLPVEEQANEPGKELVDEASEIVEDEITEPVA